LFSTLGIYRGDFYNASTYGGWWWERDAKLFNPIIDLAISLAIIGIMAIVIWALTG
jgi:hypothetical protein